MKKSLVVGIASAVFLAVVLLGCLTNVEPAPVAPSPAPSAPSPAPVAPPPALIAPSKSWIQAETPGFSPFGGAGHSTMGLSLLFGNSEAIKTWTVDIAADGVVRKSWAGDGAYLPANLSWDGRNDAGNLVSEGTHEARLSIEYSNTYQPVSLVSNSFVLDITPPTGIVSLDPPWFVPADKGVTGPVTFTIKASSALAQMDTWSLDLYDPAGSLVNSFSGAWPDTKTKWDGSSLNGGVVSPATTYLAVATVRDVYGNTSWLRADVLVTDIPMTTQATSVRPQLAGFSPRSDTLPRSIDLALRFGNRDAVKSWRLSVSQPFQEVQRAWSGDSTNLPQVVTWDGTTATGIFAPDGAYTVLLSVDYGGDYQPVLVRSAYFVLDVTPPAGNVAPDPVRLTSDRKGGILPIEFTVYGSSRSATVKTWTLDVLSPDGGSVASYHGAFPAATASWDGTLSGGGQADPTKQYTYVAQIRDEYGNVGAARGSLATGELATVQGDVNIVAMSDGFSPYGDVTNTMSFSLSYGQPSAVTGWKVRITSPGLAGQRTFTGNAYWLPGVLRWDGKTDDGSVAAEGTYTATLDLDYGRVFKPAAAASASFAVDINPPTGSISLSSALFNPIESSDTLTMAVSASSPIAKIDSWIMDIYDPGGNLFRRFSGKWPANEVVWDGKGFNGDLVQSAEDYPVVARIRDEYGNTGQVVASVPIDILVERTATGYRILASRIFFKAFTADYTDVGPALAAQNRERLDALAAKLTKFPGYQIKLVGHAVAIYWDIPAKGKIEQTDILIPLSKARAEAVKKALADRGLDAAILATEGVGASDQLVPDSNHKDRWQNRRVAVFIERK